MAAGRPPEEELRQAVEKLIHRLDRRMGVRRKPVADVVQGEAGLTFMLPVNERDAHVLRWALDEAHKEL